MQITERGKSVLAENPPSINNQLLSRFPEFNDFRERSRSSGKEKPGAGPIPTQILEDTPKQSPEERIDIAFQELTVALRTELLDRIRAAPPAFFEHLIVDLMLAMGYGAGGGGERLVVIFRQMIPWCPSETPQSGAAKTESRGYYLFEYDH